MKTQIENLTAAMIRKEQVIARMTSYILKVGESNVDAQYMSEYEQELRMWDEMKAERNKLKTAAK